MSNLLKESLKVLTSKIEINHSPLEYELPKKTERDSELMGKYGVLGHEKFEHEER